MIIALTNIFLGWGNQLATRLPVCNQGIDPWHSQLEEYLRTLDFKRWLTEVDPSGGCLDYLATVPWRWWPSICVGMVVDIW